MSKITKRISKKIAHPFTAFINTLAVMSIMVGSVE